ncbi:Acetyl-coenzyme A carboxylase carboxyl transferase subunit alpha [compost metagenome]
MLEHAIYSAISPNGAASILWKDASKADQAAEAMKITAKDLLEMEVIEEIVPEPRGGAHRDYEGAAAAISEALVRHLEEMKGWSGDQLKQDRYEKFRKIGSVTFETPTPPAPVEAPEEPVRVDVVNNLSGNAE